MLLKHSSIAFFHVHLSAALLSSVNTTVRRHLLALLCNYALIHKKTSPEMVSKAACVLSVQQRGRREQILLLSFSDCVPVSAHSATTAAQPAAASMKLEKKPESCEAVNHDHRLCPRNNGHRCQHHVVQR